MIVLMEYYFLFNNSNDVVNVFNLSSGETISVKNIAEIILDEMNLKNVELKYTGGKVGWSGDVPVINYDISKIKQMGWQPKFNAKESIRLAVRKIMEKL